MRILAGDVGGTKALLSIFEWEGGRLRTLREERYPSAEVEGLHTLVELFCGEDLCTIDRACFGVPGPVLDGEVRAVNLPWNISARQVAERTRIGAVVLINDFEAVGYGLEALEPHDLLVLQEGRHAPRRPAALIGAGTGLGEAFLLWIGDRRIVYPTEGGHTDFAPRNELECRLLLYLARRFGHVSYERVLSGPGLVNLYRFLVDEGIEGRSIDVEREMQREDPAAVISARAIDRADPACERALDLFLSIYGAEAGNLALKVLASGGVYVAGGIAPRITTAFAAGTFLAAFRDKGRHDPLMEEIPVRVVRNVRVGLLGAARFAALLP
ncbi:MAG: glucokinase [Candidatus Eisenbacteria bacterium]